MTAPEMEKINYVDLAEELILSQYKNKPNINGLLEVHGLSMNNLQDAIWELRDEFWLETSTGVQLDTVGKILKTFERTSDDDEVFRHDIQINVSLHSSGTVNEIINILIAIYGATFVKWHPEYPGKQTIWTDGTVTLNDLEKISMGGVGVKKLAPLVTAAGAMIIDHNDGDGIASANGGIT